MKRSIRLVSAMCLSLLFGGGCAHTTFSIGTVATGAGNPTIVSKSILVGRVQQQASKQDFYFIVGPPIGTADEYQLQTHSSTAAVGIIGSGFIWVEGQNGKAETKEVTASAEHTRFVLQSEASGVIRVYHYNHSPGQRVRVTCADGSIDKVLDSNSFVELQPGDEAGTFSVKQLTKFKADFSDLAQPQQDFLKAVEKARLDAHLPDSVVP